MRLLKKVIFFLLLFFIFSSLTRNLLEYQKNLSFHEDFKKNYEKVKKENTTLKTAILKSSDPQQVEKVIRNKLNLLKLNEIALIIPNPTPTPIIITPTPLPVYKQWVQVFFGN